MSDHPDSIVAQATPQSLRGDFSPPGDKSISHRALIISALARGKSRIEGLLLSKDVEAAAQACRQLGAQVEVSKDGCLVEGVGKFGLKCADAPLDMGNSGTAIRLLAGVLAAQPFDSVLTGDESLRSRPMNRIASPLRQMGAVVETGEDGCAPIRIKGGHQLRGIHYHSPVASAQVKSCVLLAGLYASGETAVTEPALSRDHTERMLRTFGANFSGSGAIRGDSRLTAISIQVPADISSAAFSMVAAALVPGSDVLLRDVGLNPSRAGIVAAMLTMGCNIDVSNERRFGEEPVGDIRVRWCGNIRPVSLAASHIPAIIDELPVLMILATQAEGVTKIRGARELRVKESDRIAVMANGLKTLGFNVREYEDGIDIEGKPKSAGISSQEILAVDAAGDHRCAMSFSVLAQTLDQPVRISGAEHIDTSYPGFLDDLSSLGGVVRRSEDMAHV